MARQLVVLCLGLSLVAGIVLVDPPDASACRRGRRAECRGHYVRYVPCWHPSIRHPRRGLDTVTLMGDGNSSPVGPCVGMVCPEVLDKDGLQIDVIATASDDDNGVPFVEAWVKIYNAQPASVPHEPTGVAGAVQFTTCTQPIGTSNMECTRKFDLTLNAYHYVVVWVKYENANYRIWHQKGVHKFYVKKHP